ncbi:MAG TPA: adenylate/guanylate cyclase domain-containing protein, partial [Armatimonadota bacterium]|nr:adenylate/guanylate cyclase domain-containing protein [Armatimonadota bacterium]
AVFTLLATTGFVLIFVGIFLDAVALVAAAVLAMVLVTQLTFALDRDERERQRVLLQRFASPQVVQQLLDNPDRVRLGGSRSHVCVLFADARNFTGFAERHSPEEVIETTNAYLVALTQSLLAHEGFLGTYTGDGLMGFFVAESDEAIRHAVSAALAMRDAVSHVSQRLRADGKETLQIGIGLHCGEAIVGLVGSSERPDYTAMGHTVIVSHRLQSIALGGEVVVSEPVYQAARESVEAEAGEPVRVKGVSAPVRPYRIHRLQAALPAAATPAAATPS